MKLTKPDYYDRFHCLAGDCPDTCCADWAVVIDDAAMADYQSLPGALGQQLRTAIETVDGEPCFGLRPDGHCRLLRDDGLCPIQRALGEAHLCRVCAVYPRFTTEIGLRREMGISLSCPEAARLILTDAAPFTLCHETTVEPMTSHHELSPELLCTLERLRDRILTLACDTTRPFGVRCATIAGLCGAVQAGIDAHRDRQLPSILEAACGNAQVLPAPAQAGGLAHFREALTAALAALEPLRPERKALLLRAAAATPAPQDWQALCPTMPMLWERLLCYGICKYFPRAAFDRRLWSAAMFALLLPLLLRQLVLTQPMRDETAILPLAWSLSRELEHAEENMALLWAAFSRRPFRPTAIEAVFLAIS